MRRPVAVAITGGIGAGKTEALQAFARHGAATVSSDEIVHHLLREDEEVEARDRRAARRGVLDDDGEIDRAAVARRSSSATAAELAWLEALLHPLVVARVPDLARAARRGSREPPAVCVDGGAAPLRGRAARRASTPSSSSRRRSMCATARTHVPLERRSARLLPDEEKVERADFAYVNDGSLRGARRVRGRRARASSRSGREARRDACSSCSARRRRARRLYVQRPKPELVRAAALSAALRVDRRAGTPRTTALDPALLAAVIYQETKFDAGGALGVRARSA